MYCLSALPVLVAMRPGPQLITAYRVERVRLPPFKLEEIGPEKTVAFLQITQQEDYPECSLETTDPQNSQRIP